MMRLFQLWLADIRAKREYEELYNDARDDAAHWRGECRRLAEMVLKHHRTPFDSIRKNMIEAAICFKNAIISFTLKKVLISHA